MSVDWVLKLCSMAFEVGAEPKNWRYVVIVSLYKGKGGKI